MGQKSTIARPYAKAIYDMAVASNTISQWEHALETLKFVMQTAAMQAFLRDTRIDKLQRATLLIEVCGDNLFAQVQDFVQLLAKNYRLLELPEIARQYVALKLQRHNIKFVEITTVNELTLEQQQLLQDKLQQRFACKVAMAVKVDRRLLGGLKLRVGDYVLDGSIKGKLQRMWRALLT